MPYHTRGGQRKRTVRVFACPVFTGQGGLFGKRVPVKVFLKRCARSLGHMRASASDPGGGSSSRRRSKSRIVGGIGTRLPDWICSGSPDSSSSPPRIALRGAHELASTDVQKRIAIHQAFVVFRVTVRFMVPITSAGGATSSFCGRLSPITPESKPYPVFARTEREPAMRESRTQVGRRSPG